MNSWKSLFLLVETLSKAEKRHLSLLASIHDGEKKYQVMLDEIEQMIDLDKARQGEEVDEDALKSRLKRRGVGSSMTHGLAYLPRMVFRSLRILNENTTQEDVARTAFAEAVILEQRGLFEPAAQKFEQVLSIAERYELWPLGMDALKHLLYVQSQQNLKNYRGHITSLCHKMEGISAQMNAEATYCSLHHQAMLLRRTLRHAHTPDVLPEVDALAEHPMLADGARANTFYSKIYFFGAWVNLSALRSDKAAAFRHAKSVVDTWEAHPWFGDEQPRRYLIALSNYLNSCLEFRDFSEYEARLKKMKDIKFGAYDDQAEQFQNVALFEHLYLLNTDRLEEAVSLTPMIEKGLRAYGRKINRSREIALRRNIAIAYFAVGDCEGALEKLTSLLNLGKSEHRPDLISASKLLRLVLHFELRHDKHLDQLVKNTGQNLRDNEQFFDFERLVLSNLNRLCQVRLRRQPPKEEAEAMRPLFGRFMEEIKSFEERSQGVHITGLAEIAAWAESRYTGQTLREVIAQQNAG